MRRTRQLEDVQKLSYSHGCSAFLCVPIPGASHGRASGGAFLLGFCSDLAPEMASMQVRSLRVLPGTYCDYGCTHYSCAQQHPQIPKCNHKCHYLSGTIKLGSTLRCPRLRPAAAHCGFWKDTCGTAGTETAVSRFGAQAAATLLAQALAPLLPSLLPLLPRPPARSASSRRHCAAVPSEASLDSRFSAGSGDHSDECSGSSGGDADGRGGAQADSDMDCESCSGRRLTPCDSKLAGRPWRAASAMLPVSLLASALAELQQVVGPQRADDRPPQLDGPSLVPEHPEGAPAAAATTPEALTLNAQLFTDMQRW